MGHFNFESLKNDWSTPKEARAKVKKPIGHTDDSHVTGHEMPNPENTKPTRLGSGDYNEEAGQLKVRNAAALLKRGIEIAASPVGERQGLIAATLANYGTLEAGPGRDVGDRPAYSRDKEAEVMGAGYNEADMDGMAPEDHVGSMGELADEMTSCECENSDCENCRGRFAKMMAHANRYAEKVGGDSALGESGEKVLRTFENSADLERNAISIAKNTRGPGGGHLAPMPKRG